MRWVGDGEVCRNTALSPIGPLTWAACAERASRKGTPTQVPETNSRYSLPDWGRAPAPPGRSFAWVGPVGQAGQRAGLERCSCPGRGGEPGRRVALLGLRGGLLELPLAEISPLFQREVPELPRFAHRGGLGVRRRLTARLASAIDDRGHHRDEFEGLALVIGGSAGRGQIQYRPLAPGLDGSASYGAGGIRTHGAPEGSPRFKRGAFNRSATAPFRGVV